MMRPLLPFVLIALMAGPVSATQLFVPDGTRDRAAATTRVDGDAARDLSSHRRALVLTDVPLASGERASFAVTPIEIFTPDATIVAFDGTRARAIGRPDVARHTSEATSPPSPATHDISATPDRSRRSATWFAI